jgi:hypothetical protein
MRRQTALRDRITHEMMLEILEILKSEERAPGLSRQGDVRIEIVGTIQRIATFEPELPSVLRDRLNKIAKTARHLRSAIRGMPEYASLDSMLARAIEGSARRADAIAPSGKLKRSGSTQASKARKLLTARLAYDLLSDWGSELPTLTADGSYIRLANLLFKTATASDSDTAAACSRYFKMLQTEHLEGLSERDREEEKKRRPWPYSKRGRQAKPSNNDEEDEPGLAELTQGDVEEFRRRRVEEASHYPPLEQLLDELLG